MDEGLLGRAVQYHGPDFLRQLQLEQHQVPPNIFLHLQKHRPEVPEINDPQYVLNVRRFVSKKADVLFRPAEPKNKTLVDPTDNEDSYAKMPPLETFMGINPNICRQHLFQSLEVKDLVIGVVTSIMESGLVLNLLCMDGTKNRDIDDLKVTAFIPVKEIPRMFPTQNPVEGYQLKDYIRGVVLNINPETENIILSLMDRMLGDHAGPKPFLGLIHEEDFPVQYRRKLHIRGLTFDELMNSILGFTNHGNVPYLLSMYQQKQEASLMRGLHKLRVPDKEYADSLKKQQSQRWAYQSVAQGIAFFKEGRQTEAMQQLNKALQIDSNNVEALVARGALYANNESYSRALKDFEAALEVNHKHPNAIKYMHETLLAKGKIHEDNGDWDDAETCYKRALEVVPDSQEAKESIRYVQYRKESGSTRTIKIKKDGPQSREKHLGKGSRSPIPYEQTTEKLKKLIEDDKKGSKSKKKSRSAEREASENRPRGRKLSPKQQKRRYSSSSSSSSSGSSSSSASRSRSRDHHSRSIHVQKRKSSRSPDYHKMTTKPTDYDKYGNQIIPESQRGHERSPEYIRGHESQDSRHIGYHGNKGMSQHAGKRSPGYYGFHKQNEKIPGLGESESPSREDHSLFGNPEGQRQRYEGKESLHDYQQPERRSEYSMERDRGVRQGDQDRRRESYSPHREASGVSHSWLEPPKERQGSITPTKDEVNDRFGLEDISPELYGEHDDHNDDHKFRVSDSRRMPDERIRREEPHQLPERRMYSSPERKDKYSRCSQSPERSDYSRQHSFGSRKEDYNQSPEKYPESRTISITKREKTFRPLKREYEEPRHKVSESWSPESEQRKREWSPKRDHRWREEEHQSPKQDRRRIENKWSPKQEPKKARRSPEIYYDPGESQERRSIVINKKEKPQLKLSNKEYDDQTTRTISKARHERSKRSYRSSSSRSRSRSPSKTKKSKSYKRSYSRSRSRSRSSSRSRSHSKYSRAGKYETRTVERDEGSSKDQRYSVAKSDKLKVMEMKGIQKTDRQVKRLGTDGLKTGNDGRSVTNMADIFEDLPEPVADRNKTQMKFATYVPRSVKMKQQLPPETSFNPESLPEHVEKSFIDPSNPQLSRGRNVTEIHDHRSKGYDERSVDKRSPKSFGRSSPQSSQGRDKDYSPDRSHSRDRSSKKELALQDDPRFKFRPKTPPEKKKKKRKDKYRSRSKSQDGHKSRSRSRTPDKKNIKKSYKSRSRSRSYERKISKKMKELSPSPKIKERRKSRFDEKSKGTVNVPKEAIDIPGIPSRWDSPKEKKSRWNDSIDKIALEMPLNISKAQEQIAVFLNASLISKSPPPHRQMKPGEKEAMEKKWQELDETSASVEQDTHLENILKEKAKQLADKIKNKTVVEYASDVKKKEKKKKKIKVKGLRSKWDSDSDTGSESSKFDSRSKSRSRSRSLDRKSKSRYEPGKRESDRSSDRRQSHDNRGRSRSRERRSSRDSYKDRKSRSDDRQRKSSGKDLPDIVKSANKEEQRVFWFHKDIVKREGQDGPGRFRGKWRGDSRGGYRGRGNGRGTYRGRGGGHGFRKYSKSRSRSRSRSPRSKNSRSRSPRSKRSRSPYKSSKDVGKIELPAKSKWSSDSDHSDNDTKKTLGNITQKGNESLNELENFFSKLKTEKKKQTSSGSKLDDSK